ncbi:hypothetical protein [Pseudomonas abietaniphila]|uniref:hypothetical protein n=1 Tax=Pseudomonas abietaniphila TaxID=89065 RepID=UPI00116002CF|nr:hypothetical protein [Pseudomonas abietaniphila]
MPFEKREATTVYPRAFGARGSSHWGSLIVGPKGCGAMAEILCKSHGFQGMASGGKAVAKNFQIALKLLANTTINITKVL